MKKFLADIPLFPDNTRLKGYGSLGLSTKSPTDAGSVFANIISTTLGLLTTIAAIWFTILLVTGAYGIMSAGGDKGKLEDARRKLSTAVLGFVVVIIGIFVVNLVGYLIGFGNLLDPATLIDTIRIN